VVDVGDTAIFMVVVRGEFIIAIVLVPEVAVLKLLLAVVVVVIVVVVVLGITVDTIVIGLVLIITVGLMIVVVEVVSGENKILVVNSGPPPHLL